MQKLSIQIRIKICEYNNYQGKIMIKNRSMQLNTLPVILEENMSEYSSREPRKDITLKSIALKT
jgi:hypothetical protein